MGAALQHNDKGQLMATVSKNIMDFLKELRNWLKNLLDYFKRSIVKADQSVDDVLHQFHKAANRLDDVFNARRGRMAARYEQINQIAKKIGEDAHESSRAHKVSRKLRQMMEEDHDETYVAPGNKRQSDSVSPA